MAALACSSDTLRYSCIATRLFRTITRLGNRGLRRAEIAVVDAAFLKACGIKPQKAENVRHTETGQKKNPHVWIQGAKTMANSTAATRASGG